MKQLAVVIFLALLAAGVVGVWVLVSEQRHDRVCEREQRRLAAQFGDDPGPLNQVLLDDALREKGC